MMNEREKFKCWSFVRHFVIISKYKFIHFYIIHGTLTSDFNEMNGRKNTKHKDNSTKMEKEKEKEKKNNIPNRRTFTNTKFEE